MGRDLGNPICDKSYATAWSEAVNLMNVGHVHRHKGGERGRAYAIEYYGRAIAILDSAPNGRDNAVFANSFGSVVMNRGQLLYEMGEVEKAEADFENAARILKQYSLGSYVWAKRNLAGTLINHANLQLDFGLASEALAKAKEGIELIESSENPVDCELAILGRRAGCDAIGQMLPSVLESEQDELAALASDWVDDALAVVQARRTPDRTEPFAEVGARLFRFGVRLYGKYQPQFLSDFIEDHLKNMGNCEYKSNLAAFSKEGIAIGIETLGERLHDSRTTLEQIDEIGLIVERFQDLSTVLDQYVSSGGAIYERP